MMAEMLPATKMVTADKETQAPGTPGVETPPSADEKFVIPRQPPPGDWCSKCKELRYKWPPRDTSNDPVPPWSEDAKDPNLIYLGDVDPEFKPARGDIIVIHPKQGLTNGRTTLGRLSSPGGGLVVSFDGAAEFSFQKGDLVVRVGSYDIIQIPTVTEKWPWVSFATRASKFLDALEAEREEAALKRLERMEDQIKGQDQGTVKVEEKPLRKFRLRAKKHWQLKESNIQNRPLEVVSGQQPKVAEDIKNGENSIQKGNSGDLTKPPVKVEGKTKKHEETMPEPHLPNQTLGAKLQPVATDKKSDKTPDHSESSGKPKASEASSAVDGQVPNVSPPAEYLPYSKVELYLCKDAEGGRWIFLGQQTSKLLEDLNLDTLTPTFSVFPRYDQVGSKLKMHGLLPTKGEIIISPDIHYHCQCFDEFSHQRNGWRSIVKWYRKENPPDILYGDVVPGSILLRPLVRRHLRWQGKENVDSNLSRAKIIFNSKRDDHTISNTNDVEVHHGIPRNLIGKQGIEETTETSRWGAVEMLQCVFDNKWVYWGRSDRICDTPYPGPSDVAMCKFIHVDDGGEVREPPPLPENIIRKVSRYTRHEWMSMREKQKSAAPIQF